MIQKESERKPVAWRYVTLVEDPPGLFTVCLPFTFNPITPGILAAARLPRDTAAAALQLGDALVVGQKIEDFIAGQAAASRRPERSSRQS